MKTKTAKKIANEVLKDILAEIRDWEKRLIHLFPAMNKELQNLIRPICDEMNAWEGAKIRW